MRLLSCKLKKILVRLVLLLIFYHWTNVAFAIEILTAGDSITQGLQRTSNGVVYGVVNPVNGAANVGGYQSRLNNLLDADFEPSTLYNWGVAGENSIQGLNRIGSILNSRFADYILIMYGANDLYQGVSSNTTKTNLSGMIDQSRAKNVIPIIAEITPNTSNGGIDLSICQNYNPKIRSLAQEKGARIAFMYGEDMCDGSIPDREMRKSWNGVPYHSGDGLHLSNMGYDKMTEIWFGVLKRINIVPMIELLLLD